MALDRSVTDKHSTSPQSSVSSIQFARPSDCVSFTSSDEASTSRWAATATKSLITSKRGTNSTFETSYGSIAPDAIPRYRDDAEKWAFKSTYGVPPLKEGNARQSGSSLNNSEASNIPYQGPRLEARRSQSELEELAAAHARAIAMYQNRHLNEMQEITCETCLMDGSTFVLKNQRELTLHIHMHNMPEYTPYHPIKDGVRRAIVKNCCLDDSTTLEN